MVRSLLSIVLSYSLLLCTWPTLSFARDQSTRRKAERQNHESAVGTPVLEKKASINSPVGKPELEVKGMNPMTDISLKANQGTNTNQTIQTERYVSSLFVIVVMAVVATTVLSCQKVFQSPSWDVADYYLSIGAAAAAVIAEIVSFGMYQGSTFLNFQVGASDDDRKLTDEQRQAIMQERQMLESIKQVAQYRAMLFGASAAMFTIAAIIAGVKATIHYVGMVACELSISGVATANLTECNALVTAATAGASATIVGVAATEAARASCTACTTAVQATSGFWATMMADLAKPFPSDKTVKAATARFDTWGTSLEAACGGVNAAYNHFAVAHNKSCEVYKQLTVSSLISCHQEEKKEEEKKQEVPKTETPKTDTPKPAPIPISPDAIIPVLNKPIEARELFFSYIREFLSPIQTSHAQIPGMDLLGMLGNVFAPKSTDATANKVAKGATVAGGAGLVLGGWLLSSSAMVQKFIGPVKKYVDQFLQHPIVRLVLYGVLAGMIGSLAAYNQLVLIPNMDKEIAKLDAIIMKFGSETNKSLGKPPAIISTGFDTSLARLLDEAVDVEQPLNTPCPAGGDGKGGCVQIQEDQEFLLNGPDFLSQAKASSGQATRLTNSVSSGRALGKQGLQDVQGLNAALKKLKSERELIKKKAQEQLSKSGASSTLLDDLEKSIASGFNSIFNKVAGSAFNLPVADGNINTSIDPNLVKDLKNTEGQGSSLKATKGVLGDSAKPDWDVKYDYSEPSQEQELAALASGEGYQAAGAQSDVSEYKEENIFNQITLRYFKTAYPIIFKEVK